MKKQQLDINLKYIGTYPRCMNLHHPADQYSPDPPGSYQHHNPDPLLEEHLAENLLKVTSDITDTKELSENIVNVMLCNYGFPLLLLIMSHI